MNTEPKSERYEIKSRRKKLMAFYELLMVSTEGDTRCSGEKRLLRILVELIKKFPLLSFKRKPFISGTQSHSQ